MARYEMFIGQMQGHEHCTGYNAYCEYPGRAHCQHERHADHGGAKAGNELAAHRTANKLNDADGHDQRCNAIEWEVAIGQRSEQCENTATYGANETEAHVMRSDGEVACAGKCSDLPN